MIYSFRSDKWIVSENTIINILYSYLNWPTDRRIFGTLLSTGVTNCEQQQSWNWVLILWISLNYEWAAVSLTESTFMKCLRETERISLLWHWIWSKCIILKGTCWYDTWYKKTDKYVHFYLLFQTKDPRNGCLRQLWWRV